MIRTSGGLPLGRRIAYWRSRRGMSQQVFADRLGKSKSWVEKVERGVRTVDRYSVLREIAHVLEIDVHVLLAQAPGQQVAGSSSGGVDRAMIEAIRATLTVPAEFGQRPSGVPDQDKLSQDVAHAWMSLARAGYDSLLRSLPRLIRDGHWVRADRHDDLAAALLGEVYQITADVLRRVGEHHLAWLAADRAVLVSADGGDPLLTARAAVPLAEAVRAAGRPRHAVELAMTMVHRLTTSPDARGGGAKGTNRRRLTGTLMLQAAMGAARTTDVASTRKLLGQAAHVAKQVGDDPEDRYRTWFGPALVDIVRFAAAVALGRGRAARARLDELANRPDYEQLPAAIRAAHLIEVARAHLQAGDPTAAGNALLDAARIAPAEVRVRPLARTTLAAVLRRTDRPGPVTRLAEIVGVTV